MRRLLLTTTAALALSAGQALAAPPTCGLGVLTDYLAGGAYATCTLLAEAGTTHRLTFSNFSYSWGGSGGEPPASILVQPKAGNSGANPNMAGFEFYLLPLTRGMSGVAHIRFTVTAESPVYSMTGATLQLFGGVEGDATYSDTETLTGPSLQMSGVILANNAIQTGSVIYAKPSSVERVSHSLALTAGGGYEGLMAIESLFR